MIGKWKDLLYVLQKFLNCEVYYSLTLLYHKRVLLHFEYGNLIIHILFAKNFRKYGEGGSKKENPIRPHADYITMD